ncbi:MAG: ABC transporter permease [Bacteroidetes bacterium]|nr:ABC transporter permease [Bacteroidota bacterium]
MFNLEDAIGAWRTRFSYTRTINSDDLDEMERHLRDQIDELVASGIPPREAFLRTTAEMGTPFNAGSEFGKVRWPKLRNPSALRHEIRAATAMFRNNAKVAYRSLWRNKVPTTINVVGLAIALACCTAVYAFVSTWYSLDSFHENGDRILLAQHEVDRSGSVETWGSVPMPLGPAMEADIPQVARAVRVNRVGVTIRSGDLLFDDGVTFVDPGFFDVLTFPLESGSPDALTDPSAVIISKAAAQRLFGDQEAMGKPLVLTFENGQTVVSVGGVVRATPSNNAFQFSVLMGFDAQRALTRIDPGDWATLSSGLFVLSRESGTGPEIAAQARRYLTIQNAAAPDWQIQSFGFDTFTDPSPNAWLIRGRIAEPANPILTGLIVAIAAFMLLLACFNYINIALGSVAPRLREIGLRKVIGGNRRQLIAQFMTENVVLCSIALVIGIVLARLVLVPLFNQLFVIQLALDFWSSVTFWSYIIGLLAFVAAISGAYPAIYVASFQPTTILRGRQKLADNAWFTRAFLTFQFVLAFVTVIMGVVLTMNSRYLIRQDWGYDPSQTLVFELESTDQFEPMRNSLSQHPGVVEVGGARRHIGRSPGNAEIKHPDGESMPILRYDVDPHYAQTLGLRLRSGRLFDAARSEDAGNSVVVNEKLVQAMRWSDPIGETIAIDTARYNVVGVVDDFSFFLLADPMPTAMVSSAEAGFPFLTARVGPDASEDVMAFAEATYARLFPESRLVASYRQDTVFDATYDQYNRVTQAFNYIALLALLIAAMGLFGLASQNITRRLKEMSLRKIAGATLTHLAFLVNRRFVALLTLAAVIATAICVVGINLLISAVRTIVPVAHMPLTPLPFVIAYLVVATATMLAVGAHVHKIARANPADVLRSAG